MPETQQPREPINVLHLLGSATSTFYFDLSIMYGRTCVEFEGLNRTDFRHQFAVVHLNGKWSFPAALDEAAVRGGEQMSLGAALSKIEALSPPVDVLMPHMFCNEGLTRYRSLFEMLGIEVLGCDSMTCAVGQDKFLTKASAAAAGVPVPKGQLLRRSVEGTDLEATAKHLLATQQIPFILKPAHEDNSIGLSLVRSGSLEAVTAALSKGFQYDDFVLAEEYIAGREVRVGVLEVADEAGGVRLEVLPKLEYILEDIREQRHKLGTDASGKLLTGDGNLAEAFQKAKAEGERICPAKFDPEVEARLDELAKKAHVALGCKYYSLYDVRVSKEGFPFMLESCLFCSFSPYSVIVSLASNSSDSKLQPHPKVFENLLQRAAGETRARRAASGEEDGAMVTGSVKKRKSA